jgi:nucleotide-binding universal stress UspA family protein
MPETSDVSELDDRPVVVGMDGSRDAIAGLERAIEWSRTMQVPIVVVHVRHAPLGMDMSSQTAGRVPTLLDDLERDARAITEDMLGDSRLSWSFEAREGAPADELIAAANTHDARAIIVGSRGHNTIATVLLGSVSSALVHRAPQSIVVVRPTLEAAPET